MPLEDQRVLVNDTLFFDLLVREARGDEMWSFSAPSIPDIDRHAALYQSGGTASFRWSPLASHASPVPHQFSFTVESGGETDTETINIEVVQAGGAPRFIQPPPGRSYDLGANPQIVVDIEVIDEDSVNVSITEKRPLILGGNISQTDGHRARWTWTPTQQQIDATLRYTLNLEANDGEGDPVRQGYEIVLLTENDDCPGTGPVITVMAEDLYETVQDYEIRATIVDDQRFRDDPILYYSTEPPDAANPDVTRMDLVTATKVSGDEYAGFIPNLGLPNPGDERTMYFVWSATDNNDAESTACDLTTLSPVGQFTAVEPRDVDLVGYCSPCSSDRQCENGLCVVAEPSFCGVDCGAGCAEGTCQEITSRGGSTSQQCVPDEQRCGGGTFECTPDGTEPANDEFSTAPPITLGTAVSGTICEDDWDLYSINLTADMPYVFTATGWNAEEADLDLVLFDSEEWDVDYTDDTTDTEIMEHCPMESGTYYITIVGYNSDDMGPYSLIATEGTYTCDPPCVMDSHEPNESIGAARSITCGTGVDATICPGDEDYFQLTVSSPSTLDATMTCESGGDDIDLFIQDSTGALVGTSGTSFECNEDASASVAAGTYYLRVRGYGGSAVYDLDCEISTGAGCTDTLSCPSGNVCDPTSGCVSDFCDDPGADGECPTDHFCPKPGGIAGSSACVDNCLTVSECRTGYACKAFEDGFFRGCGLEGTGWTGDPCEGFWECAGERTCLTAESIGYCAEVECETNADCPTDSYCIDVGEFQNICLMDCLFGDELCDTTAGSCTETTDVDEWPSYVCALATHTLPPPPG